MAVKRDYGSFAKASTRILTPLIEPLGYKPWNGQGGVFGRDKAGWVEGFFLGQSQWGSGDFCVTIGIHVPGIAEFRPDDRQKRELALLIAWRLNDTGSDLGGDKWYRAKDNEALRASLNAVAASLNKAEPWFEKFSSFSTVVEHFRVQSGLPDCPSPDSRGVSALSYGLLLFLNNEKRRAIEWLNSAKESLSRPCYWDKVNRTISFTAGPGLKQMKPSKDSELLLRIVDTALHKLDS